MPQVAEQLGRGSWQGPQRDSLRQRMQGSSPRRALLAVLLLRVVQQLLAVLPRRAVQALPVVLPRRAVQALPVAALQVVVPQVALGLQPALAEGL